ncbi:hypothetical protein ACFQMF_01800 [Halorubrum rutilum]|uniref:C2H2-type domain-containing protein n=1 Tax=Halorubrum rutilum TaxID=1364933 RepID=A0ABD6AGY6_9EURY|nr:hypothetical protein [Halorubrum rutilum]
MDNTALAAGGDLDRHVRHRYECGSCGDLAVVREREPQRSLAEFGEPITDGGRVQDGDGVSCEWDGCEETFDTQQGMRIHHVRVHDERVVEMETCDYCGEEFEPGAGSTGTYCSVECSSRARSSRVTLTCEHCGKEFELAPSEAEGRRYCSTNCYGEATNTTEVRTCPCGTTFRVRPDDDQRACCHPCEGEIRTSKPRPDDLEALLWLLYVYEDHNMRQTHKRVNHHRDRDERLTRDAVSDRLIEMGVHANQAQEIARRATDRPASEAPDGDDSWKRYQQGRGEADD